MFFHGWTSLVRVAVMVAAVYVAVVGVLRVVGERALAKRSAYDFVVTVAIGSLVATIPITESISLADGLVAILLFLLLQELTRWLQSRSRRVQRIIRDRPHVVLWDGALLLDRMREISVSPEEVRAALRREGMCSLSQALAVVLENDGDWSVLGRADAPDLTALEGLNIPDGARIA
jgi:uncharacterized membrane protein YcaP (DUF421 family)